MVATVVRGRTSSVRDDVGQWLADSLPEEWISRVKSGRPPGSLTRYPSFNVDQWVEEAFANRYLMASWPTEYGGLGVSRAEARGIFEELVRHEAPLPYWVQPLLMCGGAILASGTPEQRRKFLPGMAAGKELWCQLFSEPEAGSDLGSLRTRADRDGPSWLVNGQKVWTSHAQLSKWGMLLARSDPSLAKHRGITCLIVDMESQGVDIRPLRQLTGDASFNEVFLDRVVVPDECRLGEVNDGWRVTMGMLEDERGILSTQRVGGTDVFELIDRHASTEDALTRQRLARAYIDHRVIEFAAWRGYGEGDAAQVTKLLQSEANVALQELALDLEGAGGIAHNNEPVLSEVWYGFLRSRANTIAGGTSEIMRNIIAERILGLPRDVRP